MQQLATAPIIDVLGVVAPSGLGGCSTQGDTLSTLSFSFAAWRIAGKPLQTNELVVRREVQEKQLNKYFNKYSKLIKPNAVTRIRARVVENSVYRRPDALLVRVLGQDNSDAELNAEAKRLLKPVIIKDPKFGKFTLDRRIDWFVGRAVWNGRKVQLMLNATEPLDVKKTLKVANTLWRAQKSWQAKMSTHVVKELLSLKNELWLGDGERPLTAIQFKKRIKLESISIYPDGSFEFWHNDGNLFWGHSIWVRGSLVKGLECADLQG